MLTTLQVEDLGGPFYVSSVGQMGLALTAQDEPVVAYPRDAILPIPPTLRTAVKTDGAWFHRDVETEGFQARVKVDAKGTLHLVFPRTKENQFRYRQYSAQGKKDRFLERALRSPSMPQSHSLALDAQGNPVVLWLDGLENKVRLGTWNGRRFVTEEFDSETLAPGSGTSVGLHGQVAVAPDGAVHVVYRSTDGLNWRVKRNGVWTSETIAVTNPGEIALTVTAQGEPVILFADNGVLTLARRNSGTFSREILKTIEFPGQGAYGTLSVQVDGAGRVHWSATCRANAACFQTMPNRVLPDESFYGRENNGTWEEVRISNSASGMSMVLDSAGAPHFAWVQIRDANGSAVLRLQYGHYGITGNINTTAVTQMVDGAGGTVVSADGQAELTIPPGALSSATPIRIQRVTRIAPVMGVAPASPVPEYEFQPSGTTFVAPASLRVRMTQGANLALANPLGRSGLQPVLTALEDGAGTPEAITGRHRVEDNGDAFMELEVPHFSTVRFTRAETEIALIVPSSVSLDWMGVVEVTVRKVGAADPNTSVHVRWRFQSPWLVLGDGERDFDLMVQVPGVSNRLASQSGTFRCSEARQGGMIEAEVEVVAGTNVVARQVLPYRVNCTAPLDGQAVQEKWKQAISPVLALSLGAPQTPFEEPAQHPETDELLEPQGDHTELQHISTDVVEVNQQLAAALADPAGGAQCGATTPDNPVQTVCAPGTPPLAQEGEQVAFIHMDCVAPIPLATPENLLSYTVAVVDGSQGFIARSNAPNDPLADATVVYTINQTSMGTTVQARRPNAARTQLTAVSSTFRVFKGVESLLFAIPLKELNAGGTQPVKLRIVAQQHSGAFGGNGSGDLSLSVHPQKSRGFFDLAHGHVHRVDTAQPSATLTLIPPLNAEQPDGGGIYQEMRLGLNVVMDAGSAGLALVPGVALPWVNYNIADGGIPNCVQQATGNGTEFKNLNEVGAGAPAIFAPHKDAPNGCTVTVVPECVGSTQLRPSVDGGTGDGGASSGGPGAAGGGAGPGCPGGGGGGGGGGGPPPPTGTTITVNHGDLEEFFIQTPGRVCDDGEPAELGLGRYGMSSAMLSVGMAADLYVCARTPWGAWLRHDVFTDDNPAIQWAGPPNPTANAEPAPRVITGDRFFDGALAADNPGGRHGLIRIIFQRAYEAGGLYPTTPDTAIITAAGRSHSDDILIRKLGAFADNTGVATRGYMEAPNLYGPSESNACTTAVVNGQSLNGCFARDTTQHVDIFMDVALPGGGTRKVHVGTDEIIRINGLGDGRRNMFFEYRSNFNTERGIHRSALQLTNNTLATGTPLENLTIGILTGALRFTSAGNNQSLMGTGDHQALVPLAEVQRTATEIIPLNLSWNATLTPARRNVVGTYQPGFLVRPPSGYVATEGTPEWNQVYALPTSGPRSTAVTVSRGGAQNIPSALWSVSP